MSVIPLTIFFSLLLAGLFIALFVHEQRRRFASSERDSLLPLADETPHPAEAHGHDDHDHDHGAGPAGHRPGDGRCGCRDGSRPPCAGCLRRVTVSSNPTR